MSKKHVFMSSCQKKHVFLSKKLVFMSSCQKTRLLVKVSYLSSTSYTELLLLNSGTISFIFFTVAMSS